MHNVEPKSALVSSLPATSTRRSAAPTIAPATVALLSAPTPSAPVAEDMMTLRATCVFFGGDRPLNPSTLYRGIKAKRFPLPVRVGPNTSRWLRSECHAARQKLIEARRPEPEGVGVASD
jgi:predicted DNA-binding transcriptional regulator AlpA